MTDLDEIAAMVAAYVTGMARGDHAALTTVFHPRASSIGHFGGELEWASVDEFINACVAERIPVADPVPPHRIDSISLAGDTAVVKVVNVWAGLNFHDTLTLLKRDGRWQIVAKVFLHLT